MAKVLPQGTGVFFVDVSKGVVTNTTYKEVVGAILSGAIVVVRDFAIDADGFVYGDMYQVGHLYGDYIQFYNADGEGVYSMFLKADNTWTDRED